MGKFHHSKKNHGNKKKSPSSRPKKYDLTQSGRKKLPEDFLYTQNHKSIWIERFAEEDLSEILDDKKQDRSNNSTNAAIRAANSRTGRIGRGKALINLDMHQFLNSPRP